MDNKRLGKIQSSQWRLIKINLKKEELIRKKKRKHGQSHFVALPIFNIN